MDSCKIMELVTAIEVTADRIDGLRAIARAVDYATRYAPNDASAYMGAIAALADALEIAVNELNNLIEVFAKELRSSIERGNLVESKEGHCCVSGDTGNNKEGSTGGVGSG